MGSRRSHIARVADGFWRAVDKEVLADKLVLEEDDGTSLSLHPESRDPPTNDDSQPIDDKDIGGRDKEVMAPGILGRLDNNILAEINDAPAVFGTKDEPIAALL